MKRPYSSDHMSSLLYEYAPQVSDIFAQGDLEEMHKTIKVLEAAGLESSEARIKVSSSPSSHSMLMVSLFVRSPRIIYWWHQVRLFVGDRVQVRDRFDKPWVKGIVKELVDGRPKVKEDDISFALFQEQVQLLVILDFML